MLVSNEKLITVAATLFAFVTTVVGATIAIETRYAKSAEVKAQLEEYYSKQIKLRILEIDLKTNPTSADLALRSYLIQELNKTKK